MSWVYQISVHRLIATDGEIFDAGLYSGAFGDYQNNPDCCNLVDRGPIPPGNWKATGLVDDPKTGDYTIVLAPADVETLQSVKALGRDPFSFRMHGERIPPAAPGYASEGCIIAPRTVREAFWNSEDHSLQVTT
jgi:hypothetical protein